MYETQMKPAGLWREWPVYLVWLAVVAYLAFNDPFDFLIADDALRLVQVRDLLAGQNWFDLVQHRLQPPEGLAMHWSRLIDAPIAAISYVFGEQAMLFIWPSLLVGAFLFAALYFARRLSHSIQLIPVLLVSALCLVPLSYYMPGSIDHHNVQMVLALVMAGAILRPLDATEPAIIAALCAALMMAIGLETLPYLVVGLSVISIGWALGFSKTAPVAMFGLAFSAFTVLAWVSQTDVKQQLAVCDMLSPVYVWPIMAGGLGLALSAYAGKNVSCLGRFSLLFVTGLVALGVFAWVNPVCLAGPMAQVPLDLQQRWLATVAEAQPMSSMWRLKPDVAIERYVPLAFAFVIAAILAWKYPAQRYGLTVLLALLTSACIISVVQIRGTLFAHIYTIPIFAFAIDRARAHYNANQKSPTAIAAMAFALLTCQPLFFTMVSTFFALPNGRAAAQSAVAPQGTPASVLTEIERECAGSDVREAVARLGTGLVAAPLFYSPQLLEMGNVSVIAGQYHRATGAIFDVLKLFEDGPQYEREVLARWKPDYLVVCLSSDETMDNTAQYPESLFARLKTGDVPDWLLALPQAGQLAIYQVRHD
jgi:hypothetical protein